MFSQTLSGIIIKITNFQEADKIVTLFSKELGKAQFIAKGVRKAGSKNGGIVDLFVDGVFEVTNKQQLPTLIQSQLSSWFPYLRTSLVHWQYAERAAKALIRATKEHDPYLELYFLLKEFLEAGKEVTNPQVWWLQFLWKLLFISGFGINLNNCISCAQDLKLENIGNKAATFEGFRCTDCALKVEKQDQILYRLLLALEHNGTRNSERGTREGMAMLEHLSLVQDFLEMGFKYHFL